MSDPLDEAIINKEIIMYGFLIDPETKTVTKVSVAATLQSIREHISAACVDVVHLNSRGDVIYVDDEGLYNARHFFYLEQYEAPLAGKGLVLGTDSQGETISPRFVTLDQVQERVHFIDYEQALQLARKADHDAKQRLKEAPEGFVVHRINIAEILEDNTPNRYTDQSS